LGSIRLDKLTAEHLDRAYAAWLADGLSSTSVHHTHVVLATALHQAVRWGRINRAVTDLAEKPSLSAIDVKATDPAVVRRLVTEAEKDYPILAAAIALAAVTGCRRGELCGPQWSDLDEAGVLHVRRAVKHGIDRTKLFVGPRRRIRTDGLHSTGCPWESSPGTVPRSKCGRHRLVYRSNRMASSCQMTHRALQL
jgi:integrase